MILIFFWKIFKSSKIKNITDFSNKIYMICRIFQIQSAFESATDLYLCLKGADMEAETLSLTAAKRDITISVAEMKMNNPELCIDPGGADIWDTIPGTRLLDNDQSNIQENTSSDQDDAHFLREWLLMIKML